MSTPSDSQRMEKIVSLAKRRGFIFQSSEIYGGLNGCWDYGPLGVEMLRNLKEAWWRSMTWRDNIEGLDASILMHPRVWEASGQVQNFSDPMVDCGECCISAPGDGTGNFCERPQRDAILASKNSIRYRPDRQSLSQRDQHKEFSFPYTRVRTNGDAVLREGGNR